MRKAGQDRGLCKGHSAMHTCKKRKYTVNYKTVSVLLTLPVPVGFLVCLDSFIAQVFP